MLAALGNLDGAGEGVRGVAFLAEVVGDIINPNRVSPVEGDPTWTNDILKLKFKEFFRPIKNQPYFIHIDLAKGKESGDYMGIAMGHFTRNKTINLSDDYVKELTKAEGFSTSSISTQKQPAAVIDFMMQVRARPSQEIIFDEIRQFVQGLYKSGFNIKLVTYDGWQSIDSLQLLIKAGIPAEIQSVDRNTEAYDTLKEQIYKGLLDIYQHPVFIRECEELIRKPNGKVDHPELSYRRSLEEGRKEGSKDLSDAVAGCVNLCIKNAKAQFSAGVAGSTRLSDKEAFRRPDDQEKQSLTFYGKKV